MTGPPTGTAQVPVPTSPKGETGKALMIKTEGLSKRFGARSAVDAVNLQVPTSCCFGFLGPNGAGKTTLIRMLLGMTKPSAGTITLRGMPMPSQKAQALARVGAIVEEPRFVPYLTGRENLRVIAAARQPGAEQRIAPALERVGLTPRADAKVKTYSLGMRQRLGVARCLLADPQLLILDEPMNGLDPAGIHELRAMLRSFVAEGRTVFLSSHLLDEVEKTCDFVAVIDRGKIVEQGVIGSIGFGEQSRVTLTIGCDRPAEAGIILRSRESELQIVSGELLSDGLQLQLEVADGPDPAQAVNSAVASINKLLVGSNFAVFRLDVVRRSLEDRFLAVTSRLEAGQ